MSKQITSFVCQECGYDSPAYLGKCPECGNWNTFKEFHEAKGAAKRALPGGIAAAVFSQTNEKPQSLSEVVLVPKERITTGFVEMDTVLGGGIVRGSATLLAGDPGIGKSTLLLQLCLNLTREGRSIPQLSGDVRQPNPQKNPSSLNEIRSPKEESIGKSEMGSNFSSPEIGSTSPLFLPKTVLYISAEESKEQVAMRATRLLQNKAEKLPEKLLLLSLTNVDQILQSIEETKPDFVVIDSIQTVESEEAGGLAGSVSQIRYATSQCIRAAKTSGIPVFLVGHVTKEGMVAGPMVLSHMVDTVLFLEGEKYTHTRILRSFKNRFGPVDEVGIFIMEGDGMQEVKNPEQIFLSDSKTTAPGSVLTVILEGSRPFLIEIQALVVYSKFPMPRRVSSGLDNKRVELLLAVLQKHAHLPLENYDVFVNVAGGIKVQDRAVDLGICLAIYSSLKNKPLSKVVGIAEVGLLGELRKVPDLTKRLREARKLGFTKVLSGEIHENLMEVLENLGYTPGSKQWKQQDERHFSIPKAEEEE